MMSSASGRGKLILFGEHAAVYGYPAVGTPLPCRTLIQREASYAGKQNPAEESHAAEKARTRQNSQLAEESRTGEQTRSGMRSRPAAKNRHGVPPRPGEKSHPEVESLTADNVIRDLIQRAEKISGKRESTADRRTANPPIYQFSDVPQCGGFGSSAALCVAVSRLVLRRYTENYDREVHFLANELEKRFHGTPSGIDTGMSADREAAAWLRNNEELPERNPLKIPEWHIIYGALPRIMPTSGSVGKIQSLAAAGDKNVAALMEDLGNISSDFINMVNNYSQRTLMPEPGQISENRNPALRESSENPEPDFSEKAAYLVNRAQDRLTSLGLSTEAMDKLLDTALKLGASGGKISGGGMGGAFYLCAPNSKTRDSLIESLPEELFSLGIKLSVELKALDF